VSLSRLESHSGYALAFQVLHCRLLLPSFHYSPRMLLSIQASFSWILVITPSLEYPPPFNL
jgi:hypothetical protein